jgi:hypothetical protein
MPDGKLRLPLAFSDDDCDADGVETIGPADHRYSEYLRIALTEEEYDARGQADQIANAELLARWNARHEAQYGHRPP